MTKIDDAIKLLKKAKKQYGNIDIVTDKGYEFTFDVLERFSKWHPPDKGSKPLSKYRVVIRN